MAARQARRRGGLRAAGACVVCGEALDQADLARGASQCPECRQKARDRWVSWERAHPEYIAPPWIYTKR